VNCREKKLGNQGGGIATKELIVGLGSQANSREGRSENTARHGKVNDAVSLKAVWAARANRWMIKAKQRSQEGVKNKFFSQKMNRKEVQRGGRHGGGWGFVGRGGGVWSEEEGVSNLVLSGSSHQKGQGRLGDYALGAGRKAYLKFSVKGANGEIASDRRDSGPSQGRCEVSQKDRIRSRAKKRIAMELKEKRKQTKKKRERNPRSTQAGALLEPEKGNEPEQREK